ncbi:ABC transporter ATP-binding protein [Novipirellula artificiosorum]|uniref:ABC transporter ATP-binding protein YtrB n=1 Tax=Novipirellula artificiosorum TaxID=2528016 RepID=A0A5C6DME1_9BACT|nr:ABC transporter ATP-binding protein YtrB [Novipirellula artificiosorum]
MNNQNEVITASGLEMRFPGCDVLKGVEMNVRSGSVFALLGENGAGKTTMIRILTGFLKPTAGSVRVCGLDPIRDSLEIRRRIGYVSDAPAMYDWMTVGEIGWFTASFYSHGFVERYRELVTGYEIPENRKMKVLSRGQRAKVALSLALAHDPELLILDEPTSGLDPLVRREFLESMVDRASAGRTVFLSSHQISEVERVADTVAIMHDGKFHLCGELADLKDSISEVTINLDDPLVSLPALPSPAIVLSEETEGRQRRMIARGFTREMQDAIAARRGVNGVRARAASLEELFVACTRGIAALRPQPQDSQAPAAEVSELSL